MSVALAAVASALLTAAVAAPPSACGQDPALRLELGVPFTWRSAWVHDRTGAGGYDYSTGSPYLGYALGARVAPLRLAAGLGAPAWALPLELDLAFTQRFFRVALPGGATRDAGELRLAADVAYPWHLASGLRLTGRAGWALHRFTVEPNQILPPSRRSGPRLGAEASYPLAGAVRAEAGLRWYPGMGPGEEERRQFGADASGWGYGALVALEGPFGAGPRGLGWRAAYDLLHFSDSYAGGVAPGSGADTYHTLTVSLTWTR